MDGIKTKKAYAQLNSIDIPCKIENDRLYVCVGSTNLELSNFEVDFRADLWDEETANED